MDNEGKDIEAMSVEECEREIDTTLENPEHVYWAKNSPSQARAVQRMRLLHERVFPSKGEEPHDGLAEKLEKSGVKTLEDVERIAAEKKTGSDQDELTPEEKEALDGLKTEWGEDYETNISIAQETYEKVAEQYGDDDFRAVMDEGPGNDIRIIRLFHRIGVAQETFEKESREALNNFTCPHCGEKITDEEE